MLLIQRQIQICSSVLGQIIENARARAHAEMKMPLLVGLLGGVK